MLNPKLNLAQRVGEAKVGGRVVDRIGADNHEQVDFARLHVGNKLLKGGCLILWFGFDRVGVDDGVAGRADGLIHGVSQGVHGGGLIVSGDHDRRTLVGLQVFHRSGDKLLMLRLRGNSTANA